MMWHVDAPKNEETARAGAAIRAARERKGLNQTELRDLLRERLRQDTAAGREQTVGQSAVSRWEKGVNAPERWKWRAIEDILDMDAGTMARLLLEVPIPPSVESRLDAIERSVTELRQMFTAAGLVRQGPGT